MNHMLWLFCYPHFCFPRYFCHKLFEILSCKKCCYKYGLYITIFNNIKKF